MNNFSKRNDPKVVSNLSSNHATDIKNQSNNVYKPNSFEKRDSASFHETKVLYQNMANTVPDYTKMKGSTISTPQTEYTEEKELPRPIEDKNRILTIESKEKEMPSFTKSVTQPMINPVQELFQNAKTTTEKIEPKEDIIKIDKKKKKNKKFTYIILIAIIVELIILGIIFLVREFGNKKTVECVSENHNSYYEANIKNVKKYYFKNGKITKLEDTIEYHFDNKKAYETFKNDYASPPYSAIDGRIVVTNINDNDSIYLEKATYDYSKLRKKNESKDTHNITISSDKSYDTIHLIDYNITDIKIIYSSDYTCR